MLFHNSQPLDNLIAEWQLAKETERKAVEYRRILEDSIFDLLPIPKSYTGELHFGEKHQMKIAGRVKHKVDIDLLNEIAADNGTTDHLPALFTFKAQVNQKNWVESDQSITQPLTEAITFRVSRPTFYYLGDHENGTI
jgi:hypothetical protein